jgi:hypothetical protein
VPPNYEDPKKKDDLPPLPARDVQGQDRNTAIVNLLPWLINADPNDPADAKIKLKELRAFLLDGMEKLAQRRIFKKRIRDMLWHAILPVGGAVFAWVYPSVGKLIIKAGHYFFGGV